MVSMCSRHAHVRRVWVVSGGPHLNLVGKEGQDAGGQNAEAGSRRWLCSPRQPMVGLDRYYWWSLAGRSEGTDLRQEREQTTRLLAMAVLPL